MFSNITAEKMSSNIMAAAVQVDKGDEHGPNLPAHFAGHATTSGYGKQLRRATNPSQRMAGGWLASACIDSFASHPRPKLRACTSNATGPPHSHKISHSEERGQGMSHGSDPVPCHGETETACASQSQQS